MANGNTSPSRIGQVNGSGDSSALFLKKFAGEVLTSFTTSNVMKDLHTVRTISNGKSAQFPVTGTASAKYHVAGERITDSGNGYQSAIKANEVVINIDGLLLATSFIANIDEAMNHYDVRSIYTTEIGRALAQRFDRQVMQTAVLGATKGSNISQTSFAGVTFTYSSTTITATTAAAHGLGLGGKVTLTGGTGQNLKLNGTWTITSIPSTTTFTFVVDVAPASALSAQTVSVAYGSGIKLVNSTLLTSGSTLVAKIYEAAQALDEQNIPSEDRVCIVKPAQYYAIVQALADPSKPSPVGSFVTGDVAMVAGIKIVKSNNLPTGVVASESGQNNAYNGDFTNNAALIFHKASIGTVKLMDLAVESEYAIELQGTIMVAKYAMGHGVLRPEGIVQLAIS
jgi:hypothetical protein